MLTDLYADVRDKRQFFGVTVGLLGVRYVVCNFVSFFDIITAVPENLGHRALCIVQLFFLLNHMTVG